MQQSAVTSQVDRPAANRNTLFKTPIVLFLGDQITSAWLTPATLHDHPLWRNGGSPPGVTSETTAQILARLPALLAVSPHPDIVHILAGTFDATAVSPAWRYPCGVDTCANIDEMITLSQAVGAQVIVGTLTPLGPGPEATALVQAVPGSIGNIWLLNRTLREYEESVVIVDYAEQLGAGGPAAEGQDGWIPGYTVDGVTSDAQGAAAMSAVVGPVIDACKCGEVR